MAEEKFLSRWSRLKQEQAVEEQAIEKKPGETSAPALPPVEELTHESDFSGFMHPKVEDALRRVALKKLFSDPHFNLPDPYEAYSGDWTVGEPIPPELLATLNQARSVLFNEPKPAEEKTAEGKEPEPDEPGRQDA